jgi:hypothetical protein
MVFLKRVAAGAAAFGWHGSSALSLLLSGAVSAAAEPSDGLLQLLSIRQTTVLLLLHLPSAFNVIIPLASAGNSRVALSESTSASLGLFYVISVFTNQVAISTLYRFW